MQTKLTENSQPYESIDEELIDTLIAISVVAKRLAANLRKQKTENEEKSTEQKEASTPSEKEPTEKQYSKEEVRKILAKKANEAEGRYKAEVKTIVQKYGKGGSLTDVNPNDYEALISEVEGLKNA